MNYSKEVHLSRSRLSRGLLTVLGLLSLALGIIGIILPLLPTTPFLLLSAACFARGSSRFYSRLMNNPLCGKYIRSWRDEKRIPLNAKILAVTAIVLTLGTSILYIIPIPEIKLVAAVVGGAVIAYICHFPS